MSGRPVELRYVHLRRRDERSARVVVDLLVDDALRGRRFHLRAETGERIALPDDGRVRHAFDLPLPRGGQVRLFAAADDGPHCDWCLVPEAPERTSWLDGRGSRPTARSAPRRRAGRRAGVPRASGLLGALVASVLGLALLAYPAMALWGRGLAREALEVGRAKAAVAVHVDGADDPIGYVYGRRAGARGDVLDKSIVVEPEALAPGGSLHLWYEALEVLEDDWHDWPLGVHPRMLVVLPLGVVQHGLNRLVGTRFRVQGGSSISDQTCGRLRAGTAAEAGKSAARRKIEDIACGIGLRHHFLAAPEEIGALYATYAPFSRQQPGGVELFTRLFWGFEGTGDPRFRRGHQLVLAAMARFVWDSTDAGWDRIRRRATVALDALVARGLVADREAVLAEIEAARPLAFADVKRAPGGVDISPSDTFDYAVARSVRELTATLGEGWREQVESLRLTIRPEVQEALFGACDRVLRRLPGGVVCAGLVVDGQGRAVAAHVGDRSGPIELDLLAGAMLPPGSLGKLLLASEAAGQLGARPGEDPLLAAFEDDLRRSRPSIVERSRAIGLDPVRIGELIRCYGAPRAEADGDAIRHAALGDWRTHAFAFLPYLSAASTGRPLPPIRVVDGAGSRDGERVPIEVGAPSDPECAALAWADGRARDWLAVPLGPGGTLQRLAGLADGGKTGTVPPVRDGVSAERGTNGTFAVATATVGEAWYGGYFYVGIPSDPARDMGDPESGTRTAGGVAEAVLRALR